MLELKSFVKIFFNEEVAQSDFTNSVMFINHLSFVQFRCISIICVLLLLCLVYEWFFFYPVLETTMYEWLLRAIYVAYIFFR